MGNVTTVIDAVGAGTYFIWSGPDVTAVKDALNRLTVLGGWDVEVDPTGYSVYFLYNGDREQTYAGDADGHGMYYQYETTWPSFVRTRSDALGGTQYYGYDTKGNRTSALNTGGPRLRLRHG